MEEIFSTGKRRAQIAMFALDTLGYIGKGITYAEEFLGVSSLRQGIHDGSHDIAPYIIPENNSYIPTTEFANITSTFLNLPIDVLEGGGLSKVARVANTARIPGKSLHTPQSILFIPERSLSTTYQSTQVLDPLKSFNLTVTKHSVSRKIERGIRSFDELDALKFPLKVQDIKLDNLGRPSQRYIGKKVTVAINPETNKIISVNPTSSKLMNRLLKE